MRPAILLLILTAPPLLHATEPLPAGNWTLKQANAVLDKTRHVHLDPDLGALSSGEQAAAAKLIAVGRLFQEMYLDSIHPQALDALATLESMDPGRPQVAALNQLYYMFRGPIATTLDNRRVPFLPVASPEPGRNVYPWGLQREPLAALLASRPQLEPGLMGLRTVVRETNRPNLDNDLARLDQYPTIDRLHPGLRERLLSLREGSDDAGFYALPYSLRWAPRMMQVYELLNQAATDVSEIDPDLSAYLTLRARDLLSDNYEAGDAAWVSGDFRRLNAQIGSYESYDDALFGVRTFFSLSLLVRDLDKTAELQQAIGSIQELQDMLPQRAERQVRNRIPVGAYEVIADFGQARGTNTATILPNEPSHARKYGRTILLRGNILTNPELFADSLAVYTAAVGNALAADLQPEGAYYRTLWHEIGHYLGVANTHDGRDLGPALSPWGDLYEELKSDLVALFVARQLRAQELIDERTLKAMYAAGIRRVLQRVEPRREQSYQTMQLMQMNFFLESGLLRFDGRRLDLDYALYHDTVASMLAEVLRIQEDGDAAQATRFIDQYAVWDPDLHGRLADRLRSASPYLYYMVHYQALD
ncbi:MAG: NUDIX hydrolase [Gammaproteobacteria bacterium]